MAYQGIGTGTSPNDNTGDSLLTGAIKINSNFQEIYNALGNGTDISLTKDSIVSGIQTGITVSYDVDTGNVNYLVSNEYIQDAVGAAINAGIQTGIVVNYDDANNRINFNVPPSSPYPFTTRGFSIPI